MSQILTFMFLAVENEMSKPHFQVDRLNTKGNRVRTREHMVYFRNNMHENCRKCIFISFVFRFHDKSDANLKLLKLLSRTHTYPQVISDDMKFEFDCNLIYCFSVYWNTSRVMRNSYVECLQDVWDINILNNNKFILPRSEYELLLICNDNKAIKEMKAKSIFTWEKVAGKNTEKLTLVNNRLKALNIFDNRTLPKLRGMAGITDMLCNFSTEKLEKAWFDQAGMCLYCSVLLLPFGKDNNVWGDQTKEYALFACRALQIKNIIYPWIPAVGCASCVLILQDITFEIPAFISDEGNGEFCYWAYQSKLHDVRYINIQNMHHSADNNKDLIPCFLVYVIAGSENKIILTTNKQKCPRNSILKPGDVDNHATYKKYNQTLIGENYDFITSARQNCPKNIIKDDIYYSTIEELENKIYNFEQPMTEFVNLFTSVKKEEEDEKTSNTTLTKIIVQMSDGIIHKNIIFLANIAYQVCSLYTTIPKDTSEHRVLEFPTSLFSLMMVVNNRRTWDVAKIVNIKSELLGQKIYILKKKICYEHEIKNVEIIPGKSRSNIPVLKFTVSAIGSQDVITMQLLHSEYGTNWCLKSNYLMYIPFTDIPGLYAYDDAQWCNNTTQANVTYKNITDVKYVVYEKLDKNLKDNTLIPRRNTHTEHLIDVFEKSQTLYDVTNIKWKEKIRYQCLLIRIFGAIMWEEYYGSGENSVDIHDFTNFIVPIFMLYRKPKSASLHIPEKCLFGVSIDEFLSIYKTPGFSPYAYAWCTEINTLISDTYLATYTTKQTTSLRQMIEYNRSKMHMYTLNIMTPLMSHEKNLPIQLMLVHILSEIEGYTDISLNVLDIRSI